MAKTTYGCSCGWRMEVDFAVGQPRPFSIKCYTCGKDAVRVAEIETQSNNDDDMRRVLAAKEMMKYGGMISKDKVVF